MIAPLNFGILYQVELKEVSIPIPKCTICIFPDQKLILYLDTTMVPLKFGMQNLKIDCFNYRTLMEIPWAVSVFHQMKLKLFRLQKMTTSKSGMFGSRLYSILSNIRILKWAQPNWNSVSLLIADMWSVGPKMEVLYFMTLRKANVKILFLMSTNHRSFVALGNLQRTARRNLLLLTIWEDFLFGVPESADFEK